MSDAERTRDMTDAEVLADLRRQRRTPKAPPAERTPAWIYVFAFIGVLVVLAFIANLHS